TAGRSGLLSLQHVIGNRTVQGLLVARQQTPPRGRCLQPKFATRSPFTALPARHTRDITGASPSSAAAQDPDADKAKVEARLKQSAELLPKVGVANRDVFKWFNTGGFI